MRLAKSTLQGWFLLIALTVVIVSLVHASSLLAYAYFFLLGVLGVMILDRSEGPRFITAFLCNALLTALYVMVQARICPESYGTSMPGGAQTDDSYFFSQVAASIPPGLATREDYELSSSGFTTLVKHLTPFRIFHPSDVLFFLSIIAGVVCCYARRLVFLLGLDARAATRVYRLCLFCPLLLMNGGAVFVRDSFVAGLLMLSMGALLRRNFLLFSVSMLLQFYLRPGTALILLPLHGFLVLPQIKNLILRARLSRELILGLALGVITLAGLVIFRQELLSLLEANEISLTSLKRTGEGIGEYVSMGRSDGAFARIQNAPFVLRALFSTLFMWLVPFFHPDACWAPAGFDLRGFLLSVVYPFWIVWSHAMVLALILSPKRRKLGGPLLLFVSACFLIGMVSLESRHRTIVQPLYYILAVAGSLLASRKQKLAGWLVSGSWLMLQIAYYYLHAT